jgi:hypothetical protein
MRWMTWQGDTWQALPHAGVARLVALDVAWDAALQALEEVVRGQVAAAAGAAA